MDLVVAENRKLTAATIMSFLDHREDPDRILLDLRGVTFVDPGALVVIASIAEFATAEGSAVVFHPPTDPQSLGYLSRMHLPEVLASLGVYPTSAMPAVNEHPAGLRFLELRRFNEDSGVDDLGQIVFDLLSDDQSVARSLYRCVEEAAGNTTEHSGKSGGWTALQQYKKGNRRHVVFAVGDCGIGLMRSLSKSVAVLSDEHAIRAAAEKGVSGTGEYNRGAGLALIAEHAVAHRGNLRLISGTASGVTGTTAADMRIRSHTTAFYGTVVYATLEF